MSGVSNIANKIRELTVVVVTVVVDLLQFIGPAVVRRKDSRPTPTTTRPPRNGWTIDVRDDDVRVRPKDPVDPFGRDASGKISNVIDHDLGSVKQVDGIQSDR